RVSVKLDSYLELLNADKSASGIKIKAFAVPGKVALWLEDSNKGPNFGSVDEDTIALEVCNEETGSSFFYIPACAYVPDWLKEKLNNTNLLFFDGTLWTDDEMIAQKVGIKTGKRMGHISMSGEEGSLNVFKNIKINRKIFIHINTTNPALLDNSSERKVLEDEGWEVAYDTMEIKI
ncbi:MAG: pyrroloquinoline quinone biosynthesis protein B, partial [Pelagibacterales bacterium]